MHPTVLFVRTCALLLVLTTSCATTVYRLDGEFQTPAGRAENECEKLDWLVVAPTRAEIVPEGARVSVARDDAVGLYQVGGDSPRSITGLQQELAPHGGEDILAQKAEVTDRYDRKRIVSGSLGVAGVVGLTVGSILFVQAFETVETGNNEEEQRINGGRLTTGVVLGLVGLGLGVAGIAVNPSHEERTRANAARYVFTPDDLPREDVEEIVGAYNQRVRARCEVATPLQQRATKLVVGDRALDGRKESPEANRNRAQ
jgi:hypothetical protein